MKRFEFLGKASVIAFVFTFGSALFAAPQAFSQVSSLRNQLSSEEITQSVPPGTPETPKLPEVKVPAPASRITDDDVAEVQKSLNNLPPVQPVNIAAATSENSTVGELKGVISPDLGNVNIRSSAWGEVVGSTYGGKFVDIKGEEGDWYIIELNGRKGYVLKSTIDKTNRGFKSDLKNGEVRSAVVTNCGRLGLNVRSGAWGDKIGHLADGAAVSIIGEDGDWYKISYDGKEGYVYKAYINASASAKNSSTTASVEKQSVSSNETVAATPATAVANSSEKSTPAAARPGSSSGGILDVPERSQRAPENGRLGTSYCGPTSLAMALDFIGIDKSTRNVAGLVHTTAAGSSAGNILTAAKESGASGSYMKEGGSIEWLKQVTSSGSPVVVNVDTQGYWGSGHYMVVKGVSNGNVIVNDPWKGGEKTYSAQQFLAQWRTRNNRGIVVKP